MSYSIRVVKGDIVKQRTDAIVNAANQQLFGGSGVAGAIFDAAGYNEMTEACQKIGYCETGEAVITIGFKLPAKFVIHTVGPVYGQNNGHDAELLKSCYLTSLYRAEENNIKSITFPLISTGTYGYPKREAIDIAIGVIHRYFADRSNSGIDKVVLCALSDDDHLLIKEVLNEWTKN